MLIRTERFSRSWPEPLAIATLSLGVLLTCVSAFADDFTSLDSSMESMDTTTEVHMAAVPIAPPKDPGFTLRGDYDLRFIPAGDEIEGDLPVDVTYTVDGAEVLVVNADTDNVTFFDAHTQEFLRAVSVGDHPQGITVTPDGQQAVVSNYLGASVTLIDLDTYTTVEVPLSGANPFRALITPDSTRAIISLYNGHTTNSKFCVLDLTTQSELFSFPSAPQFGGGYWVTPEMGSAGRFGWTKPVLTPDGQTILLTDFNNAKLWLYEAATGIWDAISVEEKPYGVDVSADGAFAVVPHGWGINKITKIDLASQTVTDVFNLNIEPRYGKIRITPDQNYAIVGCGGDGTIFVDLSNGNVTANINTEADTLDLSYDGQYALFCNYYGFVVDIATQSVVKQLSGLRGKVTAVSPTELRAATLSNQFYEDVIFLSIDGAASEIEGGRPTGPLPEADATFSADITPDGRLVVAGNNLSGNLSIIDLATDTVRSWVDVGYRLREVRITPDGYWAVACAVDANLVGIVDLTTDTLVKTFTINARPARVHFAGQPVCVCAERG